MERIKIFLSINVILVLNLGISSCDKEEEIPFSRDAEGVITSMPYQWNTSLSSDGSLIDGLLRRDISYNRNVLMSLQDGEAIKMAMLNSETGEILWKWNDLFEIDKDFDISKQYQIDKLLAFQQGTRFYTIDLNDGTTIQKEERNYHALNMSGIDDIYFTSGNFLLNDNGQYVGNIYEGIIGTTNDKLLISPNYSLEYVDGNNTTGAIGSAVPFRDSTGDLLITYDFADAQPDWLGNNYVGLYNYTKQQSVYDKMPLALQVFVYASGPAVIYQDKAYYAPEKSIVCIDVYTGKHIWKRDFPEGFAFSGYIIADDVLLANCEDTYLYGLDPETGRQLWKEKSSGTSSKMSHLNGVVYFTGGGDGLLHAVEIATGKHLWRISSPDLAINRGAWFMPMVTVLHAENEEKKGKVIVSSYLSAFCYEAAR